MTKKIVSKILTEMKRACPGFEIAAYDTSGRLLGSFPTILKQPLPNKPCILSDDPSHFTAAVPIGEDGVLAFRGQAAHPEDAQMYYSLAGQITDLIYQQETTLGQISIQNDETSRLLNRLFKSTSEDDVSYILLSAAHQGYDLMLERVILLLDFPLSEFNFHLQTEVISPLLTAIKYMAEITEQDLVGQLNRHQIVICKTLTESEEFNLSRRCAAFLTKLRTLLNSRCEQPVWIGVGGIPSAISEYSTGLFTAQNAIKLAKQFGNEDKICFLDDYLLEYEISKLPRPVLDHFFAPYTEVFSTSPWMFETLKALVLHHMDQRETAKSLFIHRNTLAFRLKQIREKLNLDPYGRDSDRFTLTAFYIYTVLYYPQEKNETLK